MLKKIVFISLILMATGGCQLLSQDTRGDKSEQTENNALDQTNASRNAPLANDKRYAIEQQNIFPLDVEFEPEPIESDSLWWTVRDNLNLPIIEHKRLIKHRKIYSRYPTFIPRVSKKAAPYLYHIVNEIEKRGLPMELALLPIVESDFDPFAYSHGRASGMWQFIAATGKRFGLRINWWYDGRRDIYYSTNAALDYLEYLHKRFKGDWLHALAAYNSGEGNVNKAIRRNKKKGKPTDFWSLKLPKETEAYVPKLLAIAYLLKNHDQYELEWTDVPSKPYFAKVSVDSQIDLIVAADLADISLDEFYQLNPGFNHWATEPKRSTDLFVPIDKKETFEAALANTPKEQRIAFKRYLIKEGDSLLKLAKKFKTPVALLKSTNNIRGNTIRAGKPLLIPTAAYKSGNYKYSADNRLTKKQNRKRKGNKTEITVKSGDSFWTIARAHKVGTRELAAWNNMAPGDPLMIGKKLVVWSKNAVGNNSPRPSRKTRKVYYKVRNGDSIARIAGKFKVATADVIRWNKINPTKYLQPGQPLTLFVDVTRQN